MKDAVIISTDLFYKLMDIIHDEDYKLEERCYKERISLKSSDIEWAVECLKDVKYPRMKDSLTKLATRIENAVDTWQD